MLLMSNTLWVIIIVVAVAAVVTIGTKIKDKYY